jgi:branched-chain amino acid transport system substrate-binding protein
MKAYLGVGTALLAALSLTAGTAAPASAKVVKVGVVLPFTGAAADVAKHEWQAIELYYKLHKAELGGNDIKFITRDAKNPSGSTAQAITRELVGNDKVDILLGYQYSPNAIASAPVATAGKKLMIIVNAQTSFITKLSPYIVRLSVTSWQITYPMGEYAHNKLNCKTAIIGYADFAPGRDVQHAFKAAFEKAGGKIIDSIPMGGAAKVPDYTPFLQRMKDKHPDCTYIFTPGASFNPPLANTYRDLGLAKAGIRFLGTGDLTDDSELPQLGKAAVGWIVAGHYTADLKNEANKKFLDQWYAAYGKAIRPDFFVVQAWDAAAALFHVVKTLNGDIDADKAVAALKGWKHMSPRGPISIDPETRDTIENIYIQKVVERNGRIGIDVIDTIPNVKDPCKALGVGPCGMKQKQ